MMILDAIGASSPDQDGLNARLKNLHSSDAARPDLLLNELNDIAQSACKDAFVRLPGTSVEDVSLAIAVQVAAGTPAAAVVFANGHWLVVTDVNLGPAKPSGARPLLGFYVHSPCVTPLTPPCVHTATDDCASNRSFGGLEENQYITYETWKRVFFTGYGDGTEHLYVALSGTKAASELIELPEPVPVSIPGPQPSRSTTTGLILAWVALKMARDAIQEHNLAGGGPLTAAFTNVVGIAPEFVQMVWGPPAGSYWLVPMIRNTTPVDPTPVGVIRIDADEGTFLGAAASKDGKIETLVYRRDRADWLETGEFFAPWREWYPSRESRSPFDPFYRVYKSDGSSTLVTSDLKKRFDQPTPLTGEPLS
jgi:hypothetical protein